MLLLKVGFAGGRGAKGGKRGHSLLHRNIGRIPSKVTPQISPSPLSSLV